jgi:hypothetical protein
VHSAKQKGQWEKCAVCKNGLEGTGSDGQQGYMIEEKCMAWQPHPDARLARLEGGG